MRVTPSKSTFSIVVFLLALFASGNSYAFVGLLVGAINALGSSGGSRNFTPEETVLIGTDFPDGKVKSRKEMEELAKALWVKASEGKFTEYHRLIDPKGVFTAVYLLNPVPQATTANGYASYWELREYTYTEPGRKPASGASRYFISCKDKVVIAASSIYFEDGAANRKTKTVYAFYTNPLVYKGDEAKNHLTYKAVCTPNPLASPSMSSATMSSSTAKPDASPQK